MIRTETTDGQTIARVADLNGWSFRDDYSGRGMFGAVCPGIVCQRHEVKAVMSAVERAGVEAAASTDCMGMDAIVYWSSIASDKVAS